MAVDERRTRNPADRATVDEIRRYAEERGSSIYEQEWDDTKLIGKGVIVVWKGNFVNEIASSWIENLIPLNALKRLKHLHAIQIFAEHQTDLSFLGDLKGLTDIGISIPPKEEWLPASWRCSSTLQHLNLHYNIRSILYLPESIQQLNVLRSISLDNHSFRPISLPNWLGDFPKLERLYLDTGSFTSIPYSVVRTGLPFTGNLEPILKLVRITQD